MSQVLFDQETLHDFCVKYKLQNFRENQILYEIFKNQNIERDEMTTLPKDLREKLKFEFWILSLTCDETLEEAETTKFWFKNDDGSIIETVLMFHRNKRGEMVDGKPKLNRITICVSCQVGCPVWCVFCVTWKLGIKRNLRRDEILSQIFYANAYVKKRFGKKEDGTLWRIRNVVFMGMGEPLLNYDNIKKTLPYLLDQSKLSLSKRHVTISTVGIIPWIKRLIEDEIDVMLAVSLHAPNQQLREELIPIAKMYKLDDLMKTLDDYVVATDNRIFYEYIMINSITDTTELAHQLAKLLRGKSVHINLIPYNESPTNDFKESSDKNIKKFRYILENKWVTVTVRSSMGREQKSACGQLGYEKVMNSGVSIKTSVSE